MFALLVAGYMVLRALGIGPAGSLLAVRQALGERQGARRRVRRAGADSSLGSTIAEAVRTNLSQSRVVHILPTSTIVATLEQMKRPDTARVDFATAREIAQRAGAKAVVAGSVVPAGQRLHRDRAAHRGRDRATSSRHIMSRRRMRATSSPPSIA